MFKLNKDFIKSFSTSYVPKLIILAYVPTIVIIIFTIINLNEKFKNLDEVKTLQNRSFKIISQFYELNYYQDERLTSLIYNLYPNKNNELELKNQYAISYDYLDSLEVNYLEKLNNFRKEISSKKVASKYISDFYTDSLHKYINKIVFEHRNKTNKKDFNNLLDAYELIFKLSENYYYQITLLLDKNRKLKEIEIVKAQEQIMLLKKYLIPNLPRNLKILFEDVLNNESFKKLDKYTYQITNKIKINLTANDIKNLHNNLKDQFFILSNYTAGNIEDVSQNFYQKEKNDVIITSLFSLITILFLQIFGLRLKNLIVKNIEKNMKEISDKNKEIEELHKYVDEYIIFSKTDLKGNITYVSNAFCKISKFEEKELIGQPHNIIRHPDVPKSVFKEVWETIQSGETWIGEVKNQNKNKEAYWTKSTIGPTFDSNNKIIGYTSIRQDITQQKYAEYLNLQVSNLLDNANNGFLSFTNNLKIKDGYSKISLDILSQENLTNKIISDVLFPNNQEKKEVFEFGMKNIISADNDLSKEILISLLPQENKINEKIFSIKYKILKDDEFMVILEDITERLSLMEKIEYENRIQKMIVAIATRKNEFIELKNNFYDFLIDLKVTSIFEHSIEENFLNITKSLHTFKGLFAQEELVNTTQALHDLESEIIHTKNKNLLTNKKLTDLLTNNFLEEAFTKDLDLISKILGVDFLEPLKSIKLDAYKFKEYEERVIELLDNKKDNPTDMKILLREFLNLNQKSLKTLLSIYPTRVENIAQRLNKKINPVKIVGDVNITVRNSYQDFIKNLVHVFRNIVDHGIESEKERLNLNKYEKATIICQFKLIKNGEIELIISDDGRGINPEIIKRKALEKDILRKEELDKMTKDEVINLIFKDNFSTKEETDLLSGRGIGLSALINQLNKINGKVRVESEVNIGSKFIFTFPAQVNCIMRQDDKLFILNNLLSQCIKTFLSNNLEITLLSENSKETFDFREYYSCIKLSDDNNDIFILISFNNTLLNKIVKIFIQSELTIAQKIEMFQSLVDETLNTILGNFMSNLPNSYKNIELSPPISLDKDIIKNFMENNQLICASLETNFGKLDTLIILIKKEA